MNPESAGDFERVLSDVHPVSGRGRVDFGARCRQPADSAGGPDEPRATRLDVPAAGGPRRRRRQPGRAGGALRAGIARRHPAVDGVRPAGAIGRTGCARRVDVELAGVPSSSGTSLIRTVKGRQVKMRRWRWGWGCTDGFSLPPPVTGDMCNKILPERYSRGRRADDHRPRYPVARSSRYGVGRSGAEWDRFPSVTTGWTMGT